MVTRDEWRWVGGVALLVMLLSTVPYVAGYLGENADWKFGGAVFDRQDYNVHLASMHAGARGEWQFPMLHTSEPIPPVFLKTLYILVGHLGSWTRLTPPAWHEITRWVCGLWMLLTLYAFIARFIALVPQRRLAFLFGALGSGIGWLLMLVQWQPDPNVSPIDFWLIDLYAFFSLLTLPHFSAVMALLWTSTLAMLSHWDTRRWRWLILSIAGILLTQQTQPFAPLIVDAALVGYAAWGAFARRMPFPFTSLTLFALAQIPLALYSITLLYGDPLMANFSRQNVTLSPSPLYYVFGLGIPGVLALYGIWRVTRAEFGPAHLLVVWVLAVAVMVYLPVSFQRRFTEGVSAPLAILAVMGLGDVKMSPRARNLVTTGLVAVSMISTLYLALGGALLTFNRAPKLFEPTPVVQAMDWLGAHSNVNDTVFSSERTGSFLPARIGHRVYLGHEMETADYARKAQTVAQFFGSPMSDSERYTILRACACRFVFWGPHERALGAFDFPSAIFLREVYANESVRIFQVEEWR